ncbi:UNVERIFIED_CONTAM: SHOCT domain-containing protein [Kocuria sp. CPCC 205274]
MNFWEFLWLLVIWTPLALLWGVALVDITRREDIRGGTKVLWALVIVLLPFVGPLVYLLTRSVGAAEEQRLAAARARPGPGDGGRAHQLTLLADLRDRGALTAGEFEAEKARLLGDGSPAAGGTTAAPSSSTGDGAEDDAAGRAAARTV